MLIEAGARAAAGAGCSRTRLLLGPASDVDAAAVSATSSSVSRFRLLVRPAEEDVGVWAGVGG